jgi:hypothetical protein
LGRGGGEKKKKKKNGVAPTPDPYLVTRLIPGRGSQALFSLYVCVFYGVRRGVCLPVLPVLRVPLCPPP